ncbi:hypothetical protein ACIGDI_39675 [Streptomyces sp. NPDC085900]|uniref:hypothetical protein n=1 Tax=Streptomyces sp. NPDC085900 TaxID=3365737 RepID=UPI0037D97579
MALNRRPRSTANDRELRLWKVGRALSVTFMAAVLVSAGVFYGLVYLLDFQEIDTSAKLDAKTLFDLVKLSFGVVAGAGALVDVSWNWGKRPHQYADGTWLCIQFNRADGAPCAKIKR